MQKLTQRLVGASHREPSRRGNGKMTDQGHDAAESQFFERLRSAANCPFATARSTGWLARSPDNQESSRDPVVARARVGGEEQFPSVSGRVNRNHKVVTATRVRLNFADKSPTQALEPRARSPRREGSCRIVT